MSFNLGISEFKDVQELQSIGNLLFIFWFGFLVFELRIVVFDNFRGFKSSSIKEFEFGKVFLSFNC